MGYQGPGAVHHLSGDIERGSLTAMIGTNRAGKLTLRDASLAATETVLAQPRRREFEEAIGWSNGKVNLLPRPY